jgi:hypothetical protein
MFDTPTARTAHVFRGDPLPCAPRGYSWRLERETGKAGDLRRTLGGFSSHPKATVRAGDEMQRHDALRINAS